MIRTVRKLMRAILWVPVVLVASHTALRIVRRFYKFPMPRFLVNLMDDPLRRRIQPPEGAPAQHGIEPGMTVLEVGPGDGTYTVATARWIGENGRLVTIDIEPRTVERVEQRLRKEGITNVEARWANVYDLPFEDNYFDAAYMIAVFGDIPDPEKALSELQRVLKPGGTLAFSELLFDPDYSLAKTLIRKASAAGFRLKRREGHILYYTLVFEKADETGAGQRPATGADPVAGSPADPGEPSSVGEEKDHAATQGISSA